MSIGRRKGIAIAVLAAAVAAGCGGSRGSASQPTGTASVAAAIQGVTPGRIDHVTVTIAGSALPSPRPPQNLARTDDTHYAGTVTALPVGSGYTFLVEAFGATGGALYRGQHTNVTIEAGRTAPVVINLQEVDPTPGPVSRMPVIEGLSASATTVRSGWPVSVSVTAFSPEGHALTYEWQASCGGVFANATQPATSWTAPATGGDCRISVRVADGANATAATGYLTIVVQAVATVDVGVEATVNTYPVITLTAEQHVVWAEPAPEGLEVGITLDLHATADDPDDVNLNTFWSLLWSPTCSGGTFEPSIRALAMRFHNDDPAAHCILTLTVSDGRGGVTTATVETNGRDTSAVIAAGNTHTCATVDGGVRCWGGNNEGELGNNSTVHSRVPVDVSGLTGGVQATAAGDTHTCAIVNGGVRCWGYNQDGQLGSESDSTCLGSACSLVPAQVSGLESDVQAIAAGFRHTCAIVAGGVRCWGGNAYGQLGNNSTGGSLVPVQVTNLLDGAQAIAAGTWHTCAIANGAVQCWGSNETGQLGNNSTDYLSLVPVEASGFPSGVQAISAGWGHTCALVDGDVWCWGDNIAGQLGNDSTGTCGSGRACSREPVQVSEIGSGVQAIAAGGFHTCALVNGGVWCWGSNTDGQLGNDSTVDSQVPVPVRGLTTGVQAIAAGASHTCALVNDGIQCWGRNWAGQLGNNSDVLHSLVPVWVDFGSSP